MENEEIIHVLDEEGRAELMQIKHALERLQKREYGLRTRCGNAIDEPRRQAIPEAEKCFDCANNET